MKFLVSQRYPPHISVVFPAIRTFVRCFFLDNWWCSKRKDGISAVIFKERLWFVFSEWEVDASVDILGSLGYIFHVNWSEISPPKKKQMVSLKSNILLYHLHPKILNILLRQFIIFIAIFQTYTFPTPKNPREKPRALTRYTHFVIDAFETAPCFDRGFMGWKVESLWTKTLLNIERCVSWNFFELVFFLLELGGLWKHPWKHPKSWGLGSDDFPFRTGDFQVPC